jgi:hypothetical protein
MIFGDKKEFGIEINYPECSQSAVGIWVGENRIGSYQEEENVNHILKQLQRITNSFDNQC